MAIQTTIFDTRAFSVLASVHPLIDKLAPLFDYCYHTDTDEGVVLVWGTSTGSASVCFDDSDETELERVSSRIREGINNAENRQRN